MNVQWWLFLGKLWLLVCSQVNCISLCGSLLLFLVLLDWPPTSLCNINFCVENLFVHLTESLNTTRHSTSLLRLRQVSTHSYATVIYMPRSCKTVLLENNWQMSARWSNQSVFVTPHGCPVHPRLALNGYQPHLTPKAISDFVKTLPKHINGKVISSSQPEWMSPVSWGRPLSSGLVVLVAGLYSSYPTEQFQSCPRPQIDLSPFSCLMLKVVVTDMPSNKTFPGTNQVKDWTVYLAAVSASLMGGISPGSWGCAPPGPPLTVRTPTPIATHCGHFLPLHSKPPASKWHIRRHIC